MVGERLTRTKVKNLGELGVYSLASERLGKCLQQRALPRCLPVPSKKVGPFREILKNSAQKIDVPLCCKYLTALDLIIPPGIRTS